MLWRHGGGQEPTTAVCGGHTQRATRVLDAVPEPATGDDAQATVTAGRATVQREAGLGGRFFRVAADGQAGRETASTVPGGQNRFGRQHRQYIVVVVFVFVFGRERAVQSDQEQEESRVRRR